MTDSDDNPGVIAPPPLLYAAALGLGLAIDFLLFRVQTGVPASLRYGLATLLAVAAVALVAGAFLRLRRAGTRPEPWRPTTAIVTGGIYAYSRNPMYVAMALLYLAVAIAADSAIALILLLPLLVFVHYGVVAREERYLEAKFGDEYRGYKAAPHRRTDGGDGIDPVSSTLARSSWSAAIVHRRSPEKVRRQSRSLRHLPFTNRSLRPTGGKFLRYIRGL